MSTSHSRPVIFMAFANEREIPEAYLTYLREEPKLINKALLNLENENAIQVYHVSGATTKDIFSAFKEFGDRIAIFHFGGHANGEQLRLESEDGGNEAGFTQGLATLLGLSKGLKCVFLNGCSTKGQVQLLLDAGVPIVIGTSTKISDNKATEFAEQFYTGLAVGDDLDQAFSRAKAYIDTNDCGFSPTRDIVFEISDNNISDTPWGMHALPGQEKALAWRLPQSAAQEENSENNPQENNELDLRITDIKEVNEHLVKPVYKALANQVLNGFLNKDEKFIEHKSNFRRIKQDIQESYPYPIGVQIRRLVANVTEMRTFSGDRFKQILITYESIGKFIAYILLSQFWNEKSNGQEMEITQEELETIKSFCLLTEPASRTFSYRTLIHNLLDIFQRNGIKSFAPEVMDIYNEQDAQKKKHWDILEDLRLKNKQKQQEIQDNSDLEDLCKKSEYHLSQILIEISFLVNYYLLTVKNISYKRNRTTPTMYRHNWVVLNSINSDSFEDEEGDMPMATDSQSVVLINRDLKDRIDDDDDLAWDDLTEKTDKPSYFISLSPFIIDENALIGERNSNLFFYDYQDTQHGQYYYSCITKKDNEKLIIDDQKHSSLKVELNQFEHEVLTA